MGTSRSRPIPRGVGRKWSNIVSQLKTETRKAGPILNATVQTVLPTITSSNLIVPTYAAISEGIKFSDNVKKYGFENTIKKEGIKLAVGIIAPQISNSLWEIASSKIDTKSTSSATGKIAELAFKKTMNKIMAKGTNALGEKNE